MNQETVPAKPNRATMPTRPVAVTPLPQPEQTPPQIWPYWPQQPDMEPPHASTSLWRRLTYMSLGWIIAVLLALIVMLITGAVLFYRSDVITPGVHVAGINIGGRSMAEAAALLREQSQKGGIVLTADGFEQAFVPEALGIRLDAEATVKLAYQQSRSPDMLRQFIDNRGRIDLEPTWQFDPLPARQALEAVAPNFAVEPIDADIQMLDGRVVAVPAVSGQALDIDATMNTLTSDPLKALDDGRLPLTLKIVYADLTDVSQPVAEANKFLAHTIDIPAYDPLSDETLSLQLEPEQWQSWVSIALNKENSAKFDWSIDADKAAATLAEPLAALGSERYLKSDEALDAVTKAITEQRWTTDELRIFHHDQQHTVQYGETLSSIGYDYGIPYPWIEQANPGVNSLSPGQKIVIPSRDGLLPLPVVKEKRLVVSLSEQKLWAYEKGDLKWEWPVSTGIASSPTAPGIFQVQSHEPNAYAASWNLWMPDFIGIYRPVPTADFMNGFHGFPSRNGTTLLWTDDLGHRVTYGCILVDSKNSRELFDWADEGVVVEIKK
ncbi:MAG: L,D-transpeptidase family protein [Anaerolineae bacterium]|nr:L,D-transpeptidase family protein [Anaerolineae bacterium]